MKSAKKQKDVKLPSLEEVFIDPISSAMNVQLLPLSQSDKWMIAAGLLDGTKLTSTDTGVAFFQFRKRAISYEEYLSFLGKLAETKRLNLQDMVQKMRKAGEPTTTQAALKST